MFGDAEIQKADGAVFLHENVGRFQVAMNDRVLMGVDDGFAYGAEEANAIDEGAMMQAAELCEGQALDILHDKEGSSVGSGVGVVEASYRRVIQLREGALFKDETFAACGRKPGVAKEFDGDCGADVGTFGEIDHAHATFAERAKNAVGAEIFGGSESVGILKSIKSDVGNVLIEQSG
jgi:hypothetical protein